MAKGSTPSESLMLTEYPKGTILESSVPTTRGTRIELVEPHKLKEVDPVSNLRKHIGNIKTKFKVIALGGTGLIGNWQQHVGRTGTGKKFLSSGNFTQTFWHGNRFVPVECTAQLSQFDAQMLAEARALLKQFAKGTEASTYALVKQRQGQSQLRSFMLKIHNCCPLTLITDERLLRVSHIKPWKDSSSDERLDLNNVLLLSSLWDTAFDSGLITFNAAQEVLYSGVLSQDAQSLLASSLLGEIDLSSKEHYMSYHRENVFVQ